MVKVSFTGPEMKENQKITDDLIKKLGDALYAENTNNSFKEKCKEKKGKALMFANKGGWVIDTEDWKNKNGDVEKYRKLFED